MCMSRTRITTWYLSELVYMCMSSIGDIVYVMYV
jgi:hypothetical protein